MIIIINTKLLSVLFISKARSTTQIIPILHKTKGETEMGGLPSPGPHASLLADLGIKPHFSNPWSKAGNARSPGGVS